MLGYPYRNEDQSETTALLARSSDCTVSHDEHSAHIPTVLESGSTTPRESKPLPWKLMIVLWALIGAQSLAFEQIFPFVSTYA